MWNSCAPFFHSLQQILRNQRIMSRDKCQGRERAYSCSLSFCTAGLQGIPGYQRRCTNTSTQAITISDQSKYIHTVNTHAHREQDKYIFQKKWQTMDYWGIMFLAPALFVFQSPPVDPPTFLPSPPPPAASWCAGLKFPSRTEMDSFLATRSVCASCTEQSKTV